MFATTCFKMWILLLLPKLIFGQGQNEPSSPGLLPLSQAQAKINDNMYVGSNIYDAANVYTEPNAANMEMFGPGFAATSDEAMRRRQQWLSSQSGVQVVAEANYAGPFNYDTQEGAQMDTGPANPSLSAEQVWFPRDNLDMSNKLSVVSVCQPWVCTESCGRHFGVARGVCVGRECYCQTPESVAGTEWSYAYQEAWPSLFPSCGSQGSAAWSSPIEIGRDESQDLSQILTLNNFDQNLALIVENSGHTIRLLVQSSGPLPSLSFSTSRLWTLNEFSVSVSELNSSPMITLTLAQLELHWPGAEHKLEQNFAMELQLHFFDLDHFSHYEEALEKGAVLSMAVFLDISEDESVLNSAIFDAVKSNLTPNHLGTVVEEDAYLAFLQELPLNFAIYRGTQTSPPCREITWLVATETNFSVFDSQVDILKMVQDNSGQRIVSNVRNVQHRST